MSQGSIEVVFLLAIIGYGTGNLLASQRTERELRGEIRSAKHEMKMDMRELKNDIITDLKRELKNEMYSAKHNMNMGVMGLKRELKNEMHSAKHNMEIGVMGLKRELKNDIIRDLKRELKNEMYSDMKDLKSDLKSDIYRSEVRTLTAITELKSDMKKDMRDLISHLLISIKAKPRDFQTAQSAQSEIDAKMQSQMLREAQN